MWALVFGALVAAGLLVGTFASPAAAHATLLETIPANDAVLDQAPPEVVLRFDEPVEVADGAVRVLDLDGNRVNTGEVDIQDGGATLVVPIDAGERGTYTVAWRVVSEDSHNLSASFVFHVGERTGAVAVDEGDDTSVSVAAGIARWLALAATIVVIGAAAIAALATDEAHLRDRLRRLVVVSSAAGVVGIALLLVTQAAEATGRSLGEALGSTLDQAFDTRTGVLTMWRLVLLAAAGLAAGVPALWRRTPLAAGAAGLGAAAVTSAAGHAWTVDQRWLAVTADVVHLGAVGLWVGGLVALAVGLRSAVEPARLVRRFSAAALACVVVVGVTGTISAVFQIRYLEAFTNTGYGQLVLAKVVGFVVLVGFGWWNRFDLLPRIERALATLMRSVRAEIAVAAVVLALTAVLVDQAPARSTYTEPYGETIEAEDLSVQLDVTPARAGTNDLHLYFFEPGGGEPATVDAVQITAAVGDLPPRRIDVTPVTPTHVSAVGAALTAPGTWSVEVTAVHEGTPTTVTFEVPIR
jgi:copper transport protein